MALDVGDIATPELEVRDQDTGALIAAGAVSATITLPDLTVKASPADFTISNPSLGRYRASYPTTLAGAHRIRWTVTGPGAGIHSDQFAVRDAVTAVVSLPQLRTYLGIGAPDPARDEQLRDVLDAATDLCEAHTGRTYRPGRTFTETYDGGRSGLALRSGPVVSVTSVTIDAVAHTGAVLHAGDILLYDAACTPWPGDAASISVTYVAGAAVVPARAIEAVMVTAEHLWATRRGGSGLPRRGGTDGEYASTAGQWALPRRAEQLLIHDHRPGF